MPRRSLTRLLFGAGAVLCIPAAIVVIIFAGEVADLDALQAAPHCSTPSREGQANCVSVLNGKILELSPGGSKTLPSMTVAVQDATATVGFERSPASFHVGSDVVTGWWKGQLVLLGPSEASPTIITDQHPEHRLGVVGYFLGIAVIPAFSLLLAGLLVLRAPMNVDELIKGTLAQWPDPPRPVDRLVMRRVAWAYLTYGAFIAWMLLYILPGELVLVAINQPRYSPVLLVATFLVSFGAATVLASAYLTDLIRTSERRTVVVQKLERGMGRGGKETKVWYALANGRLATKFLDPPWDGHVNEGDHLEVLSDPKSGMILRVLSTPPA